MQESRAKFAEGVAPQPLIDDQLRAYAARDLDAFLGFYSADVQVLRSLGGGPQEVFVRGQNQLRQIYKDLFDSSPQLGIEILERRIESVSSDEILVRDKELIHGLRGSTDKVIADVTYRIRSQKIADVLIQR